MNIKDIIDAERWISAGPAKSAHNACLDRIYEAVSDYIETRAANYDDIIEKQDARIDELEAQVARLTGEIEYGCHCDVFDDDEPDECVIPLGRLKGCIYAERYTAPEQCPEWRPITKTRSKS